MNNRNSSDFSRVMTKNEYTKENSKESDGRYSLNSFGKRKNKIEKKNIFQKVYYHFIRRMCPTCTKYCCISTSIGTLLILAVAVFIVIYFFVLTSKSKTSEMIEIFSISCYFVLFFSCNNDNSHYRYY